MNVLYARKTSENDNDWLKMNIFTVSFYNIWLAYVVVKVSVIAVINLFNGNPECDTG